MPNARKILLVDDDPLFGQIMQRAAQHFHANLAVIGSVVERARRAGLGSR